MGYDQHWNFGIQHELFPNTIVEVDYVGNKGAFLNGTNAANNPPAGAGTIQARRPYPRFGHCIAALIQALPLDGGRKRRAARRSALQHPIDRRRAVHIIRANLQPDP